MKNPIALNYHLVVDASKDFSGQMMDCAYLSSPVYVVEPMKFLRDVVRTVNFGNILANTRNFLSENDLRRSTNLKCNSVSSLVNLGVNATLVFTDTIARMNAFLRQNVVIGVMMVWICHELRGVPLSCVGVCVDG